MSSEIFDELETVKEAARHLRKHPRTLMRWTRLPDGLPFVRLGQVPYLHIPTAKAWIARRIHRPNPVRAAGRKRDVKVAGGRMPSNTMPKPANVGMEC